MFNHNVLGLEKFCGAGPCGPCKSGGTGACEGGGVRPYEGGGTGLYEGGGLDQEIDDNLSIYLAIFEFINPNLKGDPILLLRRLFTINWMVLTIRINIILFRSFFYYKSTKRSLKCN